MEKTIVFYYSKNGSNSYLASKLAGSLNCKIEEIKPRINAHILMVFGVNFGIKKLKFHPSDYERVILVGPIWMGKFITPLKGFVNKYRRDIKKLVFVTCCGSSIEKKDEKFGHGLVFKQVGEILEEKLVHCEALPITLVLPEDKKEDGEVVMKTRLTDENFSGEILDRYNNFIKQLAVI